jgi:hypothetical protein
MACGLFLFEKLKLEDGEYGGLSWRFDMENS